MHPEPAAGRPGPEATGPDAAGPGPDLAAAERGQGDAEATAVAAVAALEDRLCRALADLDNLRKRHARDRDRARQADARRLTAGWLPVLDNLDLALGHAQADPAAIIDGVRRVRDQALAVLADLGYPRHDDVGIPFDPSRHEVVSVVDDPEAEPGTVVRVLRPGYGEAERQLRPGAVAVAGPQG